ncbi:MAG: EFR1 family ferrodoxin [Spirochaetaceae bacterium]|jgi:ferredoxin|nr:EFR1 family ferrodoxin [Spirochaetaceae bacterium]
MTKIYYFSGTGNTLAAAKRLGTLLDGEIYNIGALMCGQTENAVITAERVVILFPAYAYGAPNLVKRFASTFRIVSPYIAAFVTYGTEPGGALAEIYLTLKKHGAALAFAGGIPSVENYIPIFGTPSKEVQQKRLALQNAGVEAAAQAVSKGQRNRLWLFRPFSGFVSALFQMGKKHFVKGYKVHSQCTGCGLCAEICPAAAITIQSGMPEFSSRCEHCQACLNWCPAKAIGYIRLKPDTPRYRHPDVSVNEMLRKRQSLDGVCAKN